MKKRTLEQLLERKQHEPYSEQCSYVRRLVEAGKIKPVRASSLNGKTPALHTQYWIVEEAKDYSALEQELLYKTDPAISVDYYLGNFPVYEAERDNVRLLNAFLQTSRKRLAIPVSYNERCFEIWGYEKFLARSRGMTLLRHCGLELDFLNCYPTAEPFAYYASTRETPQKILILENKDPFFSMRRALLAGRKTLLGVPFGTLIYGAGKRVVSSFQEFAVSAEPYMRAAGNELLYFGDLDYEGIGIYENLAQICAGQVTVVPFVPAYVAMLDKAERAPRMPATKEQQNRNISGAFFACFDEATVRRMKAILEQGLYIPQEILNISDF